MLEFFHYVHIVFGVVWGGGSIAFSWIVLPALVLLEPTNRHDALSALAKLAGPVMVTSAILTMVGGLGRALIGGAISSVWDLSHGYGLLVSIALVVVIGWVIVDERGRQALIKAAEDGDTAEFARLAGRDKIITTSVIAVVLGLMGALRLGLY